MSEENTGLTLVVGTKQTIKALEAGLAKKIYIASDAHEYIISKILSAVSDDTVCVEYVKSMEELGNNCKISRPAAAAAVIYKKTKGEI